MPKNGGNLHQQFGKYGIGWALDKAFGTTFLKVVFLLVGVASGMIELVRELSKDDAGK